MDREVQQRQRKGRSKLILVSLVILILIFAAYLFASYRTQRDTLRLGSVVKDKQYPPLAIGEYDKFGRLVMHPNKIQVSCPPQTESGL